MKYGTNWIEIHRWRYGKKRYILGIEMDRFKRFIVSTEDDSVYQIEWEQE